MPTRSIKIRNGGNTRTYHKYETYSTYEEAIRTAKWHKKKNKCRYFIIKHEAEGVLGYVIPHEIYTLYLDKTIRLW